MHDEHSCTAAVIVRKRQSNYTQSIRGSIWWGCCRRKVCIRHAVFPRMKRLVRLINRAHNANTSALSHPVIKLCVSGLRASPLRSFSVNDEIYLFFTYWFVVCWTAMATHDLSTWFVPLQCQWICTTRSTRDAGGGGMGPPAYYGHLRCRASMQLVLLIRV